MADIISPEALQTQLRRPLGTAPALPVDPGTGQAQALLSSANEFGDVLGELGKEETDRKVRNDIITAKIAFSMEKKLPGNLAPEAEVFYNQLTAKKDTRKFFQQLELQQEVQSNIILNDQTLTPEQKLEQFDTIVDEAVDNFLGEAQFNPDQISTIQDIVSSESVRLSNDFVELTTDALASEMQADGSEFVRREAEAMLQAYNLITEDQGPDADTPIQAFFTVDFHDALANSLSLSLPGISRDDRDAMIIEQLSQIASNPDSPAPEILDYLDEKRPDGKPRFSSIKKLQGKIKNAQSQANNTLIAFEVSKTRIDANLLKQKQQEAEAQGLEMVNTIFASADGPRDLAEIRNMLQAIPNIKRTDLAGLVKSSKLMLESKSSGFSSINDIELLRGEIQTGQFATLNDIVSDPRYGDLGPKHMQEIMQEWNKFTFGRVEEADVTINQFANQLTSEWTSAKIASLGEDFEPTFITDPNTGELSRILPPALEIEKNNFVATYRRMARNVTRRFRDNPEQIDDELFALKLKLMENLGFSDVTREDMGLSQSVGRPQNLVKEPDIKPEDEPPTPTGREKTTKADFTQPALTIEDVRPTQKIKGGTGGKSSGEISKINSLRLPVEPIPGVHLDPVVGEPAEIITKSTQVLADQKVLTPVDIDVNADTAATALVTIEAPESDVLTTPRALNNLATFMLNEGVVKGVNNAILAANLLRMQVPKKAAEFSVLDKLKEAIRGKKTLKKFSERVGRGLDKITDFFSPAEAEGALPPKTEEAPDVKFIKQLEGFIPEAKDIGDDEITSGFGLTKTFKKGEKRTEEQATQDLIERLDTVERPFVEKELAPKIPFDLNQNQKTALTALIFNVGREAFLKSNAWKALQKGNLSEFEKQAFDPKVGFLTKNKKFLKGLQTRRKKERVLFSTPFKG